MGGLAGGRYIGPRGTTGDLTGGGGRSVMPNRDLINNVIARRQRILGARERMFEADRAAKLAAGTAGEYYPIQVPPGGGYSGGVIPRFQTGGEVTWQNATPEQWAALNKPAWAPATGAWDRQARRDQHLAARGLPPSLYTGANKRYLAPRFRRGFSGPPVPIPPGGGYSGGVIPRFQQGRALTPRAVKRAWGMNRPHDPNVSRRSMSLADQARSAAQILAGQIPHFGPESGGSWGPPPPGGWQAGGQFEEPVFPVESELADESPWYPDEEVGYEEAAPMQGGFDIFGRGGG